MQKEMSHIAPKFIFKCLFIGIIFITIFGSLTFATTRIIEFDKCYAMRSDQLYDKALELVESYPFLLELEILGYSPDLKPIYIIRMTYDIYRTDTYDYVEKSHILLDGGVHARETMNPVMVLKMVEDYVLDYYNDSHLPGYNVRAQIQNSTFHFIPIMNPDGFDVAKYGVQTIENPVLQQTLTRLIPKLRPNRLKANLNGVDINRNFEDVYYDPLKNQWIDQWNDDGFYRNTSEPGEDFFKGYEVGSEVETQTLMAYMLKYDFRAYLTYHSMGQVIYYWIDYLGESYFYQNHTFAELAKKVTSYQMMPPDTYLENGYSTHFFANNTLKPAITLETTSSGTFPTPLTYYQHEYEAHKLWAVPLAFVLKIKSLGYFDYKVYVNEVYVRDFQNLEVAKAFAIKMGGEVHFYKGAPSYRLSKKASVILPENIVLKESIQSFDGRTFVSFKEVFEAYGYEVSWNSLEYASVASRENSIIKINLKSLLISKANESNLFEKVATQSKPVIFNKHLMIPIEVAMTLLNVEPTAVEVVINDETVYKDF